MKKLTFIYCDLNKLAYQDTYPLKNRVVLGEIKKAYGEITDKMQIWIYSDTFKNGKFDPMVYPGIIYKLGSEYDLRVDKEDMKYLSESEKFRDYSVVDIIGRESFETMNKE